ncbi:hypothetical protein BDZ97DRAFT_1924576 [Flammula alnicola]|nr:hypothetical protein BDZ97DRAFT_1924576 [Flammula alnicola]
MPSSPLSNQGNTTGAFVTSSMPSSPLSNQGNTAGASVKLEESMSPSLSSCMSKTPQVLTLTRSAIALPDIQEILRSSTLQKPVSNNSDSPNIPKASPLLLSTPMNKAKHLLDTPPGLAPPKRLRLHNAIPATPYTFDIRPPAPYILAYGPFTPIETGYPHSLPLTHDYRIFMMHAVGVDPHRRFAYRNHSLFNHAPLIVTLPSLSNNDLYFPLPSMQLEFVEDVISLLRGQHSQCNGLPIPHELLTYQMKFTVDKNADPVYRFPLIESLFALAVFWFAEEHFPDSDSDEPSHLHYLQRQPVYDNTSSDMDNFLDSDSDSYWDSLSTSETLSSSSSDSPKLSPLELEFKDGKAPGGLLFNEYVTVSPSDTQANLSQPPSSNPIVAIKSESPPPSLDYPYDSDTFAEHEGHSLVVGVIAYGPFPLVPTSESYSSSQLLLAHTYRAHFVSTDKLDARENFIYEGADSLTYQQDFNLDLPAPLKDPLPADFMLFIQRFEQYLQGYSPEKYGIELPLSVLDDRELCGYDQTGEPLYRFKGAEKLIATAVSRIRSKKLHHRLPTTPPDYGDLVLASYPLINHENDVEFVPPQIPYRRVIFSDDEPRDERDDGSTLYYCGMLGHHEAFRFHYHWPSLYDPLVNLASTTFELFLLHAHPRDKRLPDEPTPDWDSLLFPRKFHEVFPDHTLTSLLESVRATDKKSPNLWAHRIRHLLSCRKSLGLLLNSIEDVFICMGFPLDFETTCYIDPSIPVSILPIPISSKRLKPIILLLHMNSFFLNITPQLLATYSTFSICSFLIPFISPLSWRISVSSSILPMSRSRSSNLMRSSTEMSKYIRNLSSISFLY